MSEHDWRRNYDTPIASDAVDFLREDTRYRLGKCIEKAEIPQMTDVQISRLIARLDAAEASLSAERARAEAVEKAARELLEIVRREPQDNGLETAVVRRIARDKLDALLAAKDGGK